MLMFGLIKKELLQAYRRQAELFNPLWFFILVIALFPLSIGPEPNLLTRIAPGIIWVAALLSTMLSLERLFQDDFRDGSLEQLLLTPQPLYLSVIAKVTAHWLITALPLILISPLLALLLTLDYSTWQALVITLLLGTPTLSFIGAIGAALTLNVRKGGVLLSLLVLPLYIPVLIFATSAIDAASLNFSYNGQVAIMLAIFVTSLVLAPIAITAALRISLD